ncbi:hypothetical protein [Fodinibius sp. SL11]|uniref:hypothetical protein n=1 Tax=Fodinibius sp. SL11 TaxID=3425690 RepID=UPI003F883331
MKKPTTAIARITMYRGRTSTPTGYYKDKMWADLRSMISYCEDLEEELADAQDRIELLQSRNRKLEENLERFSPGTKNKTIEDYEPGNNSNDCRRDNPVGSRRVRNGQEV